MKELELYLHIPFCKHKCDYCDFVSAPAPACVIEQYVQKLAEEIVEKAANYRKYYVKTIFFGGGTPSILTIAQIQFLLKKLYLSFSIEPDAEITIECNPGTLSPQKLQAYRKLGINRLSLGLQSTENLELKLLGRIHTYEQFLENYHMARRLGFDNINIDLISAIPGQSVSSYEKTLERVLALSPEHISAYSLIIEEGTLFYERYQRAEQNRSKDIEQSLLPSEEEEREMYDLTGKLLNHAGYSRYEISNYCKKGRECRHNIGYWKRENYLGLGLGAASLVENVRFSNLNHLDRYLAADNEMDFRDTDSVCRLSRQEQMEEFMFLGLRMMEGVSKQSFLEQFGQSLQEVYGAVIQKQIEQGLLAKTTEGYCLTDYGIAVSNHAMAEYLL